MSGSGATNTNWVEAVLTTLALTASDHPVLIGLLLLGAFLSTALHAFTFAAHLALGLSRYLRQQFLEIRELKHLYRDEWIIWREQTIDIFRFRSMPDDEVKAALQRQNINPAQTAQTLASFAEAWLRMQHAGQGSPSNDSQAAHPAEVAEQRETDV
jgi:hypothetical protein